MNDGLREQLGAWFDDATDLVDGGYRRPHRADAAAQSTADLSHRQRRDELTKIEEAVRGCRLCALSVGRRHAVPGIGVLDPLVMVIGEAPGADEDAQGEPFVGRAGKYLDKWLEAIDISRTTNAYITNVVKCRPPGNRDPLPDEVFACNPYLRRQIAVVHPHTILIAGRVAAHTLLNSSDGLGKMRGRPFLYREIPVVVTYHPSAVLRNPNWRKPVWEDLRRLRAIIDARRSTD